MAGLIGLAAEDLEIQDALGGQRWAYEGDWIPHPVVRLTTTLPVAVAGDGGRDVVRARWGFNVGAGRPIGNCRDDRLQESKMWASMLGKSHCLFAATGVYEMLNVDGEKQSYWFRRRDGKPIVMPGLIGERGVKGEKKLCAAIVTTEPNPFFKEFHARQVCAVEPREANAWMDAAVARDAEAALGVLRPPGNDAWEAVPVDNRIFKPGRIEMEDLIQTGPPLQP